MITTKWPRLLVVGDPVTPEQADEILVRTNYWHGFSNDRVWRREVEAIAAEVSGRPIETYHDLDGEARGAAMRAFFAADRRWRDRTGVLDLHYLENHRVASCWFGGAHGWCDWNGRIGCSNFNIGKWPTDEEITVDWTTIAEAFPYLTLVAQCVEEEGEGAVAAEWHVADGRVDYIAEPSALITPVTELPEGDLIAWLTGPMRSERGVTAQRLRAALERVAKAGRDE